MLRMKSRNFLVTVEGAAEAARMINSLIANPPLHRLGIPYASAGDPRGQEKREEVQS